MVRPVSFSAYAPWQVDLRGTAELGNGGTQGSLRSPIAVSHDIGQPSPSMASKGEMGPKGFDIDFLPGDSDRWDFVNGDMPEDAH